MAKKASRAFKSDEKGDRDRSGRFLPGHSQPGPGRPPGTALDYRAIVEQKAKEAQFSLEDAVWSITQSLLTAAQQGDGLAAKLVLDRLCGKDVDQVRVTEVADPLTEEDRARRVQEILGRIAARKQKREGRRAAQARSRAAGVSDS